MSIGRVTIGRSQLRSAGTAAAGLALLVGGSLAPVEPSYAAPHPTASCQRDEGADFDFHPLGSDVAVGVPGEDIGKVKNAGAVEVRYGCDSTLAPQGLSLPHPHAGDRFGASVASGEYLDHHGAVVEALWVGVPGLDVKGHKDAGGVAVFHGSPTGLHFDRLITQATAGVAGSLQSGAHFGAALAMSVHLGEAFTLTVGEPGRDVGKAKDAGALVQLDWNEDREIGDRSREQTLKSYGFRPGSGDHLGTSMSVSADTVSVGAPGRKVDGHAGAGAVLRLSDYGTPVALLTQASPGMPGDPERGDHFGAALAGDWIGVPDESLGSATGAGMVEYASPGSPPGTPGIALAQSTPGVPGDTAAGNHFGAALTEQTGEVSGTPQGATLFVGAPGESSGAGSVTSLREDGLPTPTAPSYTGLAGRLANPAPAGAHFGAALATSGGHRVEVGAPDVGGGRVVTFLSPAGFKAVPRQESSWTQVAGTPESGDSYGAAIAQSGNDY